MSPLRRRRAAVRAAAGALAAGLIGAVAFLGACSDGEAPEDGGTEAVAARSQAVEVLLREVVRPDALGADDELIAFQLDAPLPAGTRIAPYFPDPLPDEGNLDPCSMGEEVLQSPAWLFWLDDYPRAAFVHATRYVLIDAETEQVLSIRVEGWPPCIDGEPVAAWTDDEQRAQPGHQAYARVAAPDAAGTPQPGRNATLFEAWAARNAGASVLALPPNLRAPLGALEALREQKPAVVAIDGWSKGQTGEAAFAADTTRLRELAKQRTIPDAGRRIEGNERGYVAPLTQIKTEIDRALGQGGNSVLLAITAHGGVTTSGQAYVVLGGQRVYRSQFDAMLGGYAAPTAERPDGVHFSLAVAACRSADFKTLTSPNIDRVETCASSIHDVCMFDTGRGSDPPGFLWTKAVVESLGTDGPLLDRFAEAALAGSAVAGAAKFDPLYRNPDTGEYVRIKKGEPVPPDWLSSASPTTAAQTAPPATGAALPAPPRGTAPGSAPTSAAGQPPGPSGGASSPSAAADGRPSGVPAPTAVAGPPPVAAPSVTAPPPAPTSAAPQPTTVAPAPTTAAPSPTTEDAGGNASSGTYSGPISGSGVFTGELYGESCSWDTAVSGTLTLTLTFGDTTVSGSGTASGTASDTLLSGDPESCEGETLDFSGSGPVSGSASSITARYSDGPLTVAFSGSLIGNAIVGRVTVTSSEYPGSASIPVTLNAR